MQDLSFIALSSTENLTHRKSAFAKIFRDGLTAVFKLSIIER